MTGARVGCRLLQGLACVLLILGTSITSVFAGGAVTDGYGGRDMIVYVPSQMPPVGSRALVVVLHGGLGNAQRLESMRSERGLNMDATAEKYGFIVAYLNGTPVTRFFGSKVLGWNAGGGCCGQSAANNIDDVGYISDAVKYLTDKYGIDRRRVFGMGHSNGAMMSQRLICETSVFAAVVAVSGPLNQVTDHCPAAPGRRVLAIHGADDENVPVAGGRGTKGLSGVAYSSESRAEHVFVSSGGSYTLDVVAGADHSLDHIDAQLVHIEGRSVAEKSADFFGLTDAAH